MTWDNIGEKIYETGTDRGALYFPANGSYGNGVPWNGLTGVKENPSGGDSNDLWADNIKYASLTSAEKFGFTIEAYTYPDEFMACDGSVALGTGVYMGQQNRSTFGFSYRTLKGNDESGTEYGYLLHLVYGCKASPSGKDYSTVNDSPDAITFSWEVETTPVPSTTGGKPTATITIDSTKIDSAKLTAIETELYTNRVLPLPARILEILNSQ
jgi:hypothetical protein